MILVWSAPRYSDVVADLPATLDPDRLQDLVAAAETILADSAIVYPLVRRPTGN